MDSSGLLLGLQVGAHVDRLAHVHIDAPVALVEKLAALDDGGGLLLLLRGASQLLQVGLLLHDAVIPDEDGNDGKILVQFHVRLDDHGKHPVLRHDHLSRPAPPPFDEKLEGIPESQQCLDVGLHHLPVEEVAAEGPANKKSPRLAENVAQRPEHEIRTRRDKGQRDVVLVEDVGQKQVIDVTAVARNDETGHAPGDFAEPGEPLPVDDDPVIDVVPEPGEGLLPELDVKIAVFGGDLFEIPPRLLPDRGKVFFRRRGVLFHEANEFVVTKRPVHDLLAGLDAGTQGRTRLAVDPADEIASQRPGKLQTGARLPPLSACGTGLPAPRR